MIWCTICALEGHEASDSQTAGIMAMQGQQQTFGNRITCQICEAITHQQHIAQIGNQVHNGIPITQILTQTIEV